MRVQGLAEIVLNVRDRQASLAFYRDLLGLTVISPPDLPNIFLQAGPAQVGIPQMLVLVPLPPDAQSFAPPRTLHHLALAVVPEEFDTLVARLEQHGYAPRGGRHPVIPSRTIYVDDPDGNEVEFICRAA